MNAESETSGCDRGAAITRSLLGWGIIAGLVYLAVGIVLALTREGFDLAQHPLSLLMLGHLGWAQKLNLILCGAMTLAAGVGFGRAMRSSGLAGLLVAGYGVCLIGSGIFPPDPMAGFPEGTIPGEPSMSGILHLALGGVGFLLLSGAAFSVTAWCRRCSESGWATYSWISGLLVLAGFMGGAALSTRPIGIGLLWLAVVAGWSWLAAVSLHLYREVRDADREESSRDPVSSRSAANPCRAR